MDSKIMILWADDEIELLKPHILFLEEKGYGVSTANSGDVAIEMAKSEKFDIVFLDENMPGLSGLETLTKIKAIHPVTPVIMITKSEEEHLMDDAIGSKIADYLIKPVNPNQILLALKKNLENKRLVNQKNTIGYQQEFRSIGLSLTENLKQTEWIEIYKKLVSWELKLDETNDPGMMDIFKMQKTEANLLFGKFIEANYIGWLNGKIQDPPLLSNTLFKKRIYPLLESGDKYMVIVVDNLRFDQWKVLEPLISETYRVVQEEVYFSILPSATQYARNALFAGLMPSQIEKQYPQWWLNDEDDGGKNRFEEELLDAQLKRWNKPVKFSFNKVTNLGAGKKLSENLSNITNNQLNFLVYNFVDMLSHARTEMEIIRELADDESAYRSITKSWFLHSPLQDIIKQLASKKIKLIITTDHGTIKVTEPTKVVGDKNVNTNLRYKNGKSMDFNKKDVFLVKNPEDAFLPRQHLSSSYLFAKNDLFFAYPNNYNHYVSYYRNTFQHGGISMEEMLIPFITLEPR